MNKKYPVGILPGYLLPEIYKDAKDNKYIIPAFNIFDTNSIKAILSAASYLKSIIILQISYSTSVFNNLYNNINKYNDNAYSCVLLSKYINNISKYYNIPVILHTDHCNKKNLPWIDEMIFESINAYKIKKNYFTSHMLDLSNMDIIKNVSYCKKYLYKLNKLNIGLEIEIGNIREYKDITNKKLYNKDIYANIYDIEYAFNELNKISNNFTIAASIGNIHGIKKKEKEIKINILKNAQKKIKKNNSIINNNPINFVFHGGSNISSNMIKKIVKYGVVKININTDIQKKFTNSIRNYLKINNQCIDPRIWIKIGEKEIKNKVLEILNLCNNINTI